MLLFISAYEVRYDRRQGRSRRLDGAHNRPADRVRGHRSNVQRFEESERERRCEYLAEMSAAMRVN